jgi:hypothetical protein
MAKLLVPGGNNLFLQVSVDPYFLPLTMTPASSYPDISMPEIIELILLNFRRRDVDDIKGLFACRHVSRTFRFFARKVSYYSISLAPLREGRTYTNPIHRTYNLDQLKEHLDTHPDVSQFVKKIQIEMPDGNYGVDIIFSAEELYDLCNEASDGFTSHKLCLASLRDAGDIC